MARILVVMSIACAIYSCSDQKRRSETVLERENRLISEYHKQVVIDKGKEALFIPKEEISWYFKEENFISIDEAAVNDNICFFDTIGNIQYQALVISTSGNKIRIRCQNSKTAEHYDTILRTENIYDLDKGYPYILKVYRSK